MSYFCGRKAMLPLGFSSPGRLLSFLKSPALHGEQQGGACIRGRVGGVQKQPNFCFSIAWKQLQNEKQRLLVATPQEEAAPTQTKLQQCLLPALCPCRDGCAFLASPGGCSSAIVILLQSCMPSEFICHIPGTGIHQSVFTGLLISVRLAF